MEVFGSGGISHVAEGPPPAPAPPPAMGASYSSSEHSGEESSSVLSSDPLQAAKLVRAPAAQSSIHTEFFMFVVFPLMRVTPTRLRDATGGTMSVENERKLGFHCAP